MHKKWPQNLLEVLKFVRKKNVIIWVTIAKVTLEKTKDNMTNITSDTAAT